MNDITQMTATEIAIREGNEMIKALINNVIDLGTTVQGTSELIRQLPNQQEALERWNQQLAQLAESIGKLETGVKGMDMQLVGMEALQGALDRLASMFEKPLVKTVHYRHFLGKSALVFLGMWVIVVVVMTLWVMGWKSSDRYAANDQKWRYIELVTDAHTQAMVDSTERRYEADPGQFKKDLDAGEERRREITAYLVRREEVDSEGLRLQRGQPIQK